jgi:hypothetical protein
VPHSLSELELSRLSLFISSLKFFAVGLGNRALMIQPLLLYSIVIAVLGKKFSYQVIVLNLALIAYTF